MKLTFICFMAFVASLMSCVSTSKYQSLTSRSEQLQFNNVELKKENDSLHIITGELQLTKEQLAKTENVLIEFYQKYEGKIPSGDSKSYPKTESQWDTVQSEMNKLVQENSRLQDKIKNYEIELDNLRNQLIQSNNKQSSVKEKNKTDNVQEKQLEESTSSQKKFKTELSNKETEIGNLKKEVATLKFNKTEFQKQGKQNELLIDSLNSEIQYLNIKNKDLAVQISDLNAKFEDQERTNREMQNSDKINLQNEITNLNIKLHTWEDEKQALSDSIKLKNDQISLLQQSLEENKTILNQQQLKLEEKLNKNKDADHKAEVAKLKSDLTLSEKSLNALNEAISDKNQEIKDLKEQLDGNSEEITSLKKQLSSKNNESIDRSKYENLTNVLQIEKDSLLNNLDKLQTEKDKYSLENHQLSDELNSKNKQIEILSLKLSEKSAQVENIDKLKPLQDSLTYFQNEKIRMQHVNKSLESEIRRNQSALAVRESMIDSLKTIIRLSNENKLNIDRQVTDKPVTSEPSAVNLNSNKPLNDKQKISSEEKKSNQSKPESNKLKDKSASQKQKVDSNKVSTNPGQKTDKPSKDNLPSLLIEKIKSFATTNSHTGILSYPENSEIQIVIPQSYMFEGESMAMTQKGSELILKLSSILKSFPTIKINLTGYGPVKTLDTKTPDSSFKRANTVYKLMSVSGINSAKMKLRNDMNQEHNNQNLPAAGIELKIHVE